LIGWGGPGERFAGQGGEGGGGGDGIAGVPGEAVAKM